MTSYSTKFPPLNRPPALAINPAEARIYEKEGFAQYGMNDLVVFAHCETLPLGEPVSRSDISDAPAYVYRTTEVDVSLTRDELYRFLRHNLDPDEFFVLANKFGIFFEIHSDFYDEDTGRALQPNYGPTEKQSFFYRCLDGTENPENIDDYVERWHTGTEDGIPLHRYLGMTTQEYAQWMTNPQVLYKLLFERLRDATL